MNPAAKEGDHVVAVDTHLCSGAPMPVPFDGLLHAKLSPNVLAQHRHLAVPGPGHHPQQGHGAVDVSKATTTPPHVPPPGTRFDIPPRNTARVVERKATVFVNHKPFARHDDKAETCNDPADAAVGRIVATGTVLVGG